jgi:hypothetical protein
MSALADLRGFAPNRRAAPDFAPNLERLKSTRDAAGPLGLTLVPAEARGLDALEQAFATMIGERAQALTVLTLQLLFLRASESMGNHDSKIVDAGSVD